MKGTTAVLGEWRGREAAALLACGPASVLSHGTAAALLGAARDAAEGAEAEEPAEEADAAEAAETVEAEAPADAEPAEAEAAAVTEGAEAEEPAEEAEAVEAAEAGIAVAPEDPDAFCEALGLLLDDPDGRERMGRSGRRSGSARDRDPSA